MAALRCLTALVVDDKAERHEALEGMLSATHEVDHAWSYSDAMTHLTSGSYDVVYLDHDLADFELVGSKSDADLDGVPERELTGLDVAAALARMPRSRWPERVVVHSWNPAGAAAMVALLSGAGMHVTYQPFSS